MVRWPAGALCPTAIHELGHKTIAEMGADIQRRAMFNLSMRICEQKEDICISTTGGKTRCQATLISLPTTSSHLVAVYSIPALYNIFVFQVGN